ncbi:MAG: hypothetical protein ACD_37C00024G0014 [uncultured bacterium]|nr:MAG: hypothetical protein ACD_37C00024G0014 [uncultured bacterium]KKP96263.1 MAG: Ribocuclease J [Candidatus Levybacteria bacterium GW2011_GWA2_36_13]KKQ58243.1 MAG: Ribocuclease J [Microgenomates group bacterium GW2011_GWC1_38_14]KKR17309.1 MAG: Ribocuclease J [Candidatus Levybacteria bacterium GW2011_GWA1_39_32]OGH44000.1 MAG: hypothetical protein A3I49_00640 [Candidatus Levybacteria bacterium RIFCSPLOWO2_02_FULL_37_11]
MDKLSYIPLGGVTKVTKNMHLYEYGDSVLIVDCGLGFADETMMGVDLLLPDITYLKNSKKKIVGMVITHGHEDHMGALPYILPDLPGDFQIFASKFTTEIANDKLKEFGVARKINFLDFGREVQIGPFKITLIRVTHSVPDTSHVFIKTPIGNFYHGSDFKFDPNPYDGKRSDIEAITSIARQGVLCLLSDCLGSEKPGKSRSESTLTIPIEEEMRNTKGKFILTTYSSNIARLNQTIDAARKLNKFVCFLGRSLIKAADLGQRIKYLNIEKSIEISIDQLKNIKDNNVVLIVAGAQGQEGSALSRIVNGDHKDVTIKPNDTVVFSADPIPGNEVSVYSLVDAICKIGARVIYSEISDAFHVSGHGTQDDLAEIMDLVSPKYLLPIGGTYRHIVSYRDIALKKGYTREQIIMPDDGLEIIFEGNKVSYGRKLPIKNVYVDQLSGEEIESFVLRDREKLSKEGIVILMIEVDASGQIFGNPNIIVKGFPSAEITKIVKGLPVELRKKLSKKSKVSDWNYERKTIGNIVERFIFYKFRRRPLVLPVVIEV